MRVIVHRNGDSSAERKAGTTDDNTVIPFQLPPIELAFYSSSPVWSTSLANRSIDFTLHQSPADRITLRDEEPDRRQLPTMLHPQLPEDEFGPQDPSSFTETGAITPFVGTPATGAVTTAAAATSQSQQQVPLPPHKRSLTQVGRSSSPPTGGRQRTLSGRTPAVRELIMSPSRQPVIHATSPSMWQAQSPQATVGPSLDEPFLGQTSPLPPGGGQQTSADENQAAATLDNGNQSRDRTAEAAGGSPLVEPQRMVHLVIDPMQVEDTHRRRQPAGLLIDQRTVISSKSMKAHLHDTRSIVRNRPVLNRPTVVSAIELLRRPAIPGSASERRFAGIVNTKRPVIAHADDSSDVSSDDAVASASLASNSMNLHRAADDGSATTPAGGMEDILVPLGITPGSTDSRVTTPSIHVMRAGPVDDIETPLMPVDAIHLQTSVTGSDKLSSLSSTPSDAPARSSGTSNLSGPPITSLTMPPIDEDVETLAEDVRRTSLGVDNETTFFTVCPHSRSRMVATMKYMALLVGVERCMFDMRQEVPYQDITIRYIATQL